MNNDCVYFENSDSEIRKDLTFFRTNKTSPVSLDKSKRKPATFLRTILLLGTTVLAPLSFAQSASAQQSIDSTTHTANSCATLGGTLVGGNFFTDFNNGTFGTIVGGVKSPASSPYGLPQIDPTDYKQYIERVGDRDFNPPAHGEWTIVGDIDRARNRFQHEGNIQDPNDPDGMFFHMDPDDTPQTFTSNLTGLTPGSSIEVSFWVADAEISLTSPKQTVGINVDGVEVYNTGLISNVTTGELVWYKHSMTVTVDADGELDIEVLPLDGGVQGRDIHFDSMSVQECSFAAPSLTLTKEADNDTNVGENHDVIYTYTVANTGDVDISDVFVTDVHDGAGTLSAIEIDTLTNTSGNSSDDSADNDIDVLAPGDSVTFTSTYTVTAADIAAGVDITNEATATGTPAAGSLTDPTASESISLYVPSLYPVTPQSVGVCAVDSTLYTETFDDGSDGGYTPVSQLLNYPYGLLEPINNINNDQNSVTDITIHPNLNGFSGVPSPSGGGFLGSFDAQGGEPTWVTSIGGQDWSAAINGGISFEFWNYQPSGLYYDQVLYFQIISSSGKLVLDFDITDYQAALAAGEWVTIEALFETSQPWFYSTSTNPRSESGLVPATAANFASVLNDVQTISLAPESGGGGNVTLSGSPLQITGSLAAVDAERYGMDTVQVFSCTATPAAPAMTLTKLADNDTDRKPGETVTYSYTVENTGDVNITAVSVGDQHTSSAGTSALTVSGETGDAGNSGDSSDTTANDGSWDVLAPGDSVTFTAQYVVTEDDVIDGSALTNIATVTATPAAGSFGPDPVTADESVSVAPLEADLSITKTNTPGVNGEVDQADDTLTTGDSTTYTLVVTNNGPDSVAGALVTDSVVEGLTCTGTDAVTITGDGVPSGSFTIADLTGAGIALGTLADGESATLTYACTVD